MGSTQVCVQCHVYLHPHANLRLAPCLSIVGLFASLPLSDFVVLSACVYSICPICLLVCVSEGGSTEALVDASFTLASSTLRALLSLGADVLIPRLDSDANAAAAAVHVTDALATALRVENQYTTL